eukprot:scaffold195075_cov21-Prasinocladus_malaysianus.AAC.4
MKAAHEQRDRDEQKQSNEQCYMCLHEPARPAAARAHQAMAAGLRPQRHYCVTLAMHARKGAYTRTDPVDYTKYVLSAACLKDIYEACRLLWLRKSATSMTSWRRPGFVSNCLMMVRAKI